MKSKKKLARERERKEKGALAGGPSRQRLKGERVQGSCGENDHTFAWLEYEAGLTTDGSGRKRENGETESGSYV